MVVGERAAPNMDDKLVGQMIHYLFQCLTDKKLHSYTGVIKSVTLTTTRVLVPATRLKKKKGKKSKKRKRTEPEPEAREAVLEVTLFVPGG